MSAEITELEPELPVPCPACGKAPELWTENDGKGYAAPEGTYCSQACVARDRADFTD